MTEKVVLSLLPEQILAENNARFALIDSRVQSLMSSIVTRGEVMSPVEVEMLEEVGPNGEEYSLVSGFYRHAAVTRLNAEQGAGVYLPAIIVETAGPLDRFNRQFTENQERQDLTPIDLAVCIRQMFDMGMSRKEICEKFQRKGGKKGNKVQPASNAWVNMMLSFLDFPPKIQAKIHNGDIGVSGAYELSKKPRHLWDDIIGRIESARLKEIEQDERDEEAYQEALQKEKEAAEKLEESRKAQEAASTSFQEASSAIDNAKDQEVAASTAAIQAKGTEEEEAKKEEWRKAQAATAAAKKAADAAKREKEKADAALDKLQRSAEDRQKRLAEARKEAEKKLKEKKKGGASGSEVNKAAAAAGAGNAVPLKLAEVRELVEDLSLPGPLDNPTTGQKSKVRQIGEALKEAIEGVLTPTQLRNKLAKITGEFKEKGGKVAVGSKKKAAVEEEEEM